MPGAVTQTMTLQNDRERFALAWQRLSQELNESELLFTGPLEKVHRNELTNSWHTALWRSKLSTESESDVQRLLRSWKRGVRDS